MFTVNDAKSNILTAGTTPVMLKPPAINTRLPPLVAAGPWTPEPSVTASEKDIIVQITKKNATYQKAISKPVWFTKIGASIRYAPEQKLDSLHTS